PTSGSSTPRTTVSRSARPSCRRRPSGSRTATSQDIGVSVRRAGEGEPADLELIDVLARFGGRRWYLNQFACAVRRPLCSPEADALVREAVRASDPVARETLLAEAEARLMAEQGYIPLGAPVRWSLVRGQIDGFAENRWAVHPLFPLALGPT
ncbi:MAG: hypothetical protein ACEQR8_07205, partial [Cypionkella sp.]